MAPGLEEIFDLERLRRRWSGSGGTAATGATGPQAAGAGLQRAAAPPPVEGPAARAARPRAEPLVLLGQLQAALAAEAEPGAVQAAAPLFARAEELLRRQQGLPPAPAAGGEPAAGAPLAGAELAASQAELAAVLDALEDLLEALGC